MAAVADFLPDGTAICSSAREPHQRRRPAWPPAAGGHRKRMAGRSAELPRLANRRGWLPAVPVITVGFGAYVVVMRPATDMRCPALAGRAAEGAAIDEVLAAAAAGRGGGVAGGGGGGGGKGRPGRAGDGRPA